MWPAVFLALGACGALESAGNGAKQVAGWVGGELAELTVCHLDVIECGHVYQCAATADTPSGFVELCISDSPDAFAEIDEAFGPCEPTPRHQGLCRWCPDDGARGCNAYSGCWGCP